MLVWQAQLRSRCRASSEHSRRRARRNIAFCADGGQPSIHLRKFELKKNRQANSLPFKKVVAPGDPASFRAVNAWSSHNHATTT